MGNNSGTEQSESDSDELSQITHSSQVNENQVRDSSGQRQEGNERAAVSPSPSPDSPENHRDRHHQTFPGHQADDTTSAGNVQHPDRNSNEQSRTSQPTEPPESDGDPFREIMSILHGDQIPDATRKLYDLASSPIDSGLQDIEHRDDRSLSQQAYQPSTRSQNVFSNSGVAQTNRPAPPLPGSSNTVIIPFIPHMWCSVCEGNFTEMDFINSHCNHGQ